MSAPAGDASVRAADGRRLGVQEFGAPDGVPAFYFHGWPGSRLDFAVNSAAAAAAGVRVIAIDRPGMGASDPQRRRRILDWPADVVAVADALEIERFAVLGFSFGGPYARACAHALPQRVTRAVLVSAVGPLDDPAAGRAVLERSERVTLALARVSVALVLPLVWRAERAARSAPTGGPVPAWVQAADAAVLSRPEVAACLHAGTAECFRGGLQGTALDSVAVARGDGFRLEEIDTEVVIWHGEEDPSDPVSMARSQERRMPRANAHYIAGGGHLILFSHAAEILASVRD